MSRTVLQVLFFPMTVIIRIKRYMFVYKMIILN